jgi:hypothetical protein
VAIAYQPAMTAEPVTTRPISMQPEPTRVHSVQPARPTSPHTLVLVEEPLRAWTVAKIAGLVAITALSAALAAAIVVGGALFAVLTIG